MLKAENTSPPVAGFATSDSTRITTNVSCAYCFLILTENTSPPVAGFATSDSTRITTPVLLSKTSRKSREYLPAGGGICNFRFNTDYDTLSPSLAEWVKSENTSPPMAGFTTSDSTRITTLSETICKCKKEQRIPPRRWRDLQLPIQHGLRRLFHKFLLTNR
jgi:hypothetical protein